MKVKFKKYFIPVLSLFLILSNFSFAASYMYCQMNKAGFSCCCKHDDQNNNDENNTGVTPGVTPFVTIDAKDNACCKTGIKELSNANTLLSFSSQINHSIFSYPIAVINSNNTSTYSNLQSSKFIYFGDRIPPSDITITTSSLQI